MTDSLDSDYDSTGTRPTVPSLLLDLDLDHSKTQGVHPTLAQEIYFKV